MTVTANITIDGTLSLDNGNPGNAFTQFAGPASSIKTFTLPNTNTNIVTTADTGSVTNTMLAGSIAASKLTGTDIATVGTITSGIWNAGAVTSTGTIKTTAGTVYGTATSNGVTMAHIGNTTQIATVNSAIYRVNMSNNVYFFALQLSDGSFALCCASYNSATITLLNANSGNIEVNCANPPTTTRIGVRKSASSTYIYIQCGSLSQAPLPNWNICWFGAYPLEITVS